MSLTAHLANRTSPVSSFLRQHFPNTRKVFSACRRQLAEAETLKPNAALPGGTFGTLGTAFDYRLRFYFGVSPVSDLMAWRGACLWDPAWLSTAYTLPTDAHYFLVSRTGKIHVVNSAQRYFFGRPLCNTNPTSMQRSESRTCDYKLLCLHCEGYLGHAYPDWWGALTRAYFRQLETDLASIAPAGRMLSRAEEELLARHCVVLALFEQLYRMSIVRNSPLFVPEPKTTVAELLAIPAPAWIDDLCALSHLFYTRWSQLLTEPVVLNPSFAGSADVGGADGDLIIGRCLIDIKTTISPHLERTWLYQLLGYVLLDYDDQHAIEEVGLYLARQGLFLRWPLAELLAQLSNTAGLEVAALRGAFQQLVRPRPV